MTKHGKRCDWKRTLTQRFAFAACADLRLVINHFQ
jgi:hypothetical protein